MPAAASALPPGLAIIGPTGSGKSRLAMQVAAEAPVEIISVDSAQVYRGLDIGTAKPTAAERAAVAHHLIDIRDPAESYSAGEFRRDALRLIGEITARGRRPLLVGGTMLYFRALFRGIAALPGADAGVRADIDARAAREGWPALHAELAGRDPVAARRIHPHDAQRIQRALELVLVSGREQTELWQHHPPLLDFTRWTIAVLEPADRHALHALLADRLQQMFAAGFVAEVRDLAEGRLLSDESHTARLVGYRQLLPHVHGVEDFASASAKVLAATRQLAKRQLTWLRAGKLLPDGATLLHGNPSDANSMVVLRDALSRAASTPW